MSVTTRLTFSSGWFLHDARLKSLFPPKTHGSENWQRKLSIGGSGYETKTSLGTGPVETQERYVEDYHYPPFNSHSLPWRKMLVIMKIVASFVICF